MSKINDRVLEDAKKCRTRSEFQKRFRASYQKAWRDKNLDIVCAHMQGPYEKWSAQKLEKEAKKYQTRKEFREGSQKAYRAASGKGDLGRICKHMKK
jgi:hypothetical protein